MKQVNKPVQFALVPFAASVNVGPTMADETWMDRDGISPIHHENFDWSAFTASTKLVTKIGGVYYKKGSGWGAEQNQKMTRFQLFKDLTEDRRARPGTPNRVARPTKATAHARHGWAATTTPMAAMPAGAGCVSRVQALTTLTIQNRASSNPATLFVPMFAPTRQI